jgi:hypothetical protein
MQPRQEFKNSLETLADDEHYLFSVNDFRALLPRCSSAALLVLLGRAVRSGVLERVCRSLYVYPKVAYPRDLLLYHTAARLRADVFCYLSLESVLSEAGIISQIPLGYITLMTSGRSGLINCGKFGKIEFTHTKKKIEDVLPWLTYDFRSRLWRAAVPLALRDWRAVGRENDLLNLKD